MFLGGWTAGQQFNQLLTSYLLLDFRMLHLHPEIQKFPLSSWLKIMYVLQEETTYSSCYKVKKLKLWAINPLFFKPAHLLILAWSVGYGFWCWLMCAIWSDRSCFIIYLSVRWLYSYLCYSSTTFLHITLFCKCHLRWSLLLFSKIYKILIQNLSITMF